MTKTSVTFENAAFSEIIKRVDKVTPKKGDAFDKAGGILLTIDPEQDWGVQVRATNTEVYYSEWATPLEVSGDPATWRLSASYLVAMITKLPIGSGRNVTLTNEQGALSISSGRMRAKLSLIDPSFYPSWEPFDPSGTAPVADLGARVEQVAWAVERNSPGSPMSGVRIDGETLTATDKYRLVQVPLKIPHLREPIVAPLSLISGLIKQMGDTNVGVIGSMLALMPNQYTQITATMIDAKYPNVERVMLTDHSESVTLHKSQVIEMIGRVSTADMKTREPELTLFVGEEELAFFMQESDGTSSVGDVIELPGQCTHDRFKFFVTPSALIDALNAAPSEQVVLHYEPTNRRKILYIDGGSGYKCWVVPRIGKD